MGTVDKSKIAEGLAQIRASLSEPITPLISETTDILSNLVSRYEEVHGAITIPRHELVYLEKDLMIDIAKRELASQLAEHLIEKSDFHVLDSSCYVAEGLQLTSSIEMLKPAEHSKDETAR